jgi:hypothetical protein
VWQPPVGLTKESKWDRRRYKAFAIVVSVYWIGCSLTDGMATFSASSFWARRAKELEPYYAFYRVANTYSLFALVPRARIEPEIQVFDQGGWQARHLRHKPGPLARSSSLIVGHLPRVDYRMWFVGRGDGKRVPGEVQVLLERLCRNPGLVQPAFADPLPAASKAVRIQLWRYRYTTVTERAEDGAIWRRAQHGAGASLPCPPGPEPGNGAQPAGSAGHSR